MQLRSWTTPRRAAVGLLIGALAFSVTANVLLWQRAQRLAVAGAVLRLDPSGLRPYADARTRDRGRDALPVVVLYGDSRAAAWPLPPIDGVDVVNRGIGGQSTEQLVARYSVDVSPLRPKTVVIQAGVNDLTALPLLPTQRAAIVRRCKENLARLVHLARSEGAEVVLTTIFPRAGSRWRTRDREIDAAIHEVNTFIATLRTDGVHVVDVTPLLAGASGYVRSALAFDALHLNDSGYAVISPAVARLLPKR